MKKITIFHNYTIDSTTVCHVWPLSRQTKLHFPVSHSKSSVVFVLLHVDVWGPYKVPTIEGKRFFVTIVDEYSRLTWLFLINTKDETCCILKSFFFLVCTQYNAYVKILRSNNGSEFINSDVRDLLTNQGVIHHTTCIKLPNKMT